MSLAVVAGNAPTLDGWFGPGNAARAVINENAFPILRTRNESTSSNDTLNVFVDGLYADMEYGASIINICAEKTTLAIQCTFVPRSRGIGSNTCGPNAQTFPVTVGQSTYAVSTLVSTSTMGVDLVGSAKEDCKLASSTAICTAILSASAQGKSTATTTTITATGSAYHTYNVKITGGAEKTINPAATCTGTTSAAVNINPKSITAWAVAGLVGVASLLAM